ncbi:hypothetical protein RYX36_026901 [Vicia faba]
MVPSVQFRVITITKIQFRFNNSINNSITNFISTNTRQNRYVQRIQVMHRNKKEMEPVFESEINRKPKMRLRAMEEVAVSLLVVRSSQGRMELRLTVVFQTVGGEGRLMSGYNGVVDGGVSDWKIV